MKKITYKSNTAKQYIYLTDSELIKRDLEISKYNELYLEINRLKDMTIPESIDKIFNDIIMVDSKIFYKTKYTTYNNDVTITWIVVEVFKPAEVIEYNTNVNINSIKPEHIGTIKFCINRKGTIIISNDIPNYNDSNINNSSDNERMLYHIIIANLSLDLYYKNIGIINKLLELYNKLESIITDISNCANKIKEYDILSENRKREELFKSFDRNIVPGKVFTMLPLPKFGYYSFFSGLKTRNFFNLRYVDENLFLRIDKINTKTVLVSMFKSLKCFNTNKPKIIKTIDKNILYDVLYNYQKNLNYDIESNLVEIID